jgi:hypothetical protein
MRSGPGSQGEATRCSTSVTAVVLSLLVAINPKDAAYGSMPFFYAGGLVIVALAFNRASAWAARQAPPQP